MSDHEQARAWREAQNLTRAELAGIIGYSAESIQLLELGKRNGPAFRRYKAACLLAHILRTFGRPELTVDKWTWGQQHES